MTTSRPIPALALACLVAYGCAPAGPDPLLAEHELLAREVLAAWEASDIEALLGHVHPAATWDDFPNGATWRGLDEIAAYKSELHRWASDVVVNVTAVHPSPTGVVAEWVLYGVQSGVWEGQVEVEGTGREILLNGATVLEVENGRVIRGADYLDTLPLLLQIGGEVVLPGEEG